MAEGNAAIDMGYLIEHSSLGAPPVRSLRSLAPLSEVVRVVDEVTDEHDSGAGGRDELELLLAAVGASIRRKRTRARRIGRAETGDDPAQGRREAVDDAAERRVNEILETVETAGAAYARGCEAIARGDYERATEHLGDLADRGHPEAAYWLAAALEALGSQLHNVGRAAEAEKLASEAASWRQAAEAAGVVDLELRIPRSASLTHSVNSLSPRERMVVRLVAAGRTNREIASELVISVRTVEHHLSRAYAKLGVRSRRELPALLASQASAKWEPL